MIDSVSLVEKIRPNNCSEVFVKKRERLWTMEKEKTKRLGTLAGVAETVEFQLVGLNSKTVFLGHLLL